METDASAPLVLEAWCPRGHEIRYRFETTHGAVNRIGQQPARFTYQTGRAAGTQRITAFVTAFSGLTTTATLDLSVGLGDLGYAPGS